ncbi:MAG: hypothetical protein ACRYFZ_18140 [Janthinobacterium lividum]
MPQTFRSHDLRTNPELTVALKRALRLVQEIGDMAFGESARTDRWQLEKQLDRRMGEAQALAEAAGWPQPQVKQVVSQLLYEMQQAAPPSDRSYLSLEEAMDTNEAG